MTIIIIVHRQYIQYISRLGCMFAVMVTLEFATCRIELLKMQMNLTMYLHITVTFNWNLCRKIQYYSSYDLNCDTTYTIDLLYTSP